MRGSCRIRRAGWRRERRRIGASPSGVFARIPHRSLSRAGGCRHRGHGRPGTAPSRIADAPHERTHARAAAISRAVALSSARRLGGAGRPIRPPVPSAARRASRTAVRSRTVRPRGAIRPGCFAPGLSLSSDLSIPCGSGLPRCIYLLRVFFVVVVSRLTTHVALMSNLASHVAVRLDVVVPGPPGRLHRSIMRRETMSPRSGSARACCSWIRAASPRTATRST